MLDCSSTEEDTSSSESTKSGSSEQDEEMANQSSPTASRSSNDIGSIERRSSYRDEPFENYKDATDDREARLIIALCLFCCLALALLLLFLVGPLGASEEAPAPVAGPTSFESKSVLQPTEAPLLRTAENVTSQYYVEIPGARANGTLESVFSQDLVAGMDLLAPLLLEEVTSNNSRIRTRFLSTSLVELPTEIGDWSEVGKSRQGMKSS